MPRWIALALAVLPWALAAPTRADAAELVLVSPGAVSSSLRELIPRFEQSSGHTVRVKYSPALALAGFLFLCEEPALRHSPDGHQVAAVFYVSVVAGSIFSVEETRPGLHRAPGHLLGLCAAVRDRLGIRAGEVVCGFGDKAQGPAQRAMASRLSPLRDDDIGAPRLIRGAQKRAD